MDILTLTRIRDEFMAECHREKDTADTEFDRGIAFANASMALRLSIMIQREDRERAEELAST